jgi:hypothetical protein
MTDTGETTAAPEPAATPAPASTPAPAAPTGSGSAPNEPSRDQRRAKAIQYVAALDGLRAIAALGVVIIHTESEAGASITTYVITGTLAGPFFMLFFAISGFVLYRGWARKNLAVGDRRAPAAAKRGSADGGADGRAGKFLLRRLLRIYPLYWVVATAALLVSDDTGYSAMDIIQVYLLLPFPNLDALVSLGLGIVVWTLIIDIVFYVYVAIHGPVMHQVVRKLHRRWTPFKIETTVLLTMSAVILFAALFVPAPLSALVCLPDGHVVRGDRGPAGPPGPPAARRASHGPRLAALGAPLRHPRTDHGERRHLGGRRLRRVPGVDAGHPHAAGAGGVLAADQRAVGPEALAAAAPAVLDVHAQGRPAHLRHLPVAPGDPHRAEPAGPRRRAWRSTRWSPSAGRSRSRS